THEIPSPRLPRQCNSSTRAWANPVNRVWITAYSQHHTRDCNYLPAFLYHHTSLHAGRRLANSTRTSTESARGGSASTLSFLNRARYGITVCVSPSAPESPTASRSGKRVSKSVKPESVIWVSPSPTAFKPRNCARCSTPTSVTCLHPERSIASSPGSPESER